MLQNASGNTLLNTSVWPYAMTEIDFNSDDASESASGLVPVTIKHGADIEFGDTITWNMDFKIISINSKILKKSMV